MTVVEEVLDGRGTSYIVSREDGIEENVRTTCSRAIVNSLDTFVVRDGKMRILMKPSMFLTYDLEWEARNTAEQAVSAIKTLVNYCSIIGVPFEAFEIGQARAFMQFMRGTLSEGVAFSYRLLTSRTEGTVGVYLSHIRRYARWLGVANSPFLQPKSSVAQPVLPVNPMQSPPHRLKVHVVAPKETPRYISKDEYRAVLKAIDDGWGMQERCIVRLMYEHGLRIGEVLGMTIEDIGQKRGPYGFPTFSVVLRNRASDRNDQHAKTLMRVVDRKQYKSADYRRRNVGMQQVFISESLFFNLCEYIEMTFDEEVEDECPCLADSVEEDGPNRYLFVNTKGRPLSQNLWNKRLRRIMLEAGIHIDKGARRTNLNHRFRHGFAMLLTHEAMANGNPLDDFAVMTLMRHASPKSTAVYMNPTEDDIAEMQRTIIEPMWRRIYAKEA